MSGIRVSRSAGIFVMPEGDDSFEGVIPIVGTTTTGGSIRYGDELDAAGRSMPSSSSRTIEGCFRELDTSSAFIGRPLSRLLELLTTTGVRGSGRRDDVKPILSTDLTDDTVSDRVSSADTYCSLAILISRPAEGDGVLLKLVPIDGVEDEGEEGIGAGSGRECRRDASVEGAIEYLG